MMIITQSVYSNYVASLTPAEIPGHVKPNLRHYGTRAGVAYWGWGSYNFAIGAPRDLERAMAAQERAERQERARRRAARRQEKVNLSILSRILWLGRLSSLAVPKP